MTNEKTAADDRVTIVVLTYNRCDELCRSLAHLQALPEQAPIVVVDNGSTDATPDCIKAKFPRVTLVSAGKNLGAAGRNLGAAQVRTPYVAFSDDDTWWAPGALGGAADILDKHPQITVLNARIVVGPDARPDPACQAMENSPLEQVPGVGPMLIGFMAGAVVMRTNAFLHAGGYWQAFLIGGEEALLAMDILDAGGQIVYAAALQVHHWPSQERDKASRRRELARNAIWTAWLRLPWPMAWHQTRLTWKQAANEGLGLRVAAEVLRGAALVFAKRRVLHPHTCALLETVKQHEGR